MTKSASLNAIYAKIPNIQCKGLCHETCSMIIASRIESKIAKKSLGKTPFLTLPKAVELTATGVISPCSALKNNRCSIYDIRPSICRLYGVAEGLLCQFGCVPERVLTDREARNIMREIREL